MLGQLWRESFSRLLPAFARVPASALALVSEDVLAVEHRLLVCVASATLSTSLGFANRFYNSIVWQCQPWPAGAA
jgi:hypothetical protein